MPPGQQHEPGSAAAGPEHALPASPAESPRQPDIPLAESLHRPAIPPAEARPAPHPAHSAAAPQELRFDFTPPPQARQAANPFTPAPTRSRQRYLVWTACLFSGALLVLGGRWLYQERNDARSLALIADEARAQPRSARVDTAAKPPAMAAQGTAPEPEEAARVAPAMPASRPSPAVPPLVMLEPEPPAARPPEQPSPSASQTVPPVTPPPELAKEQGAAAPSPKPSSRTARARSDAVARPAKEKAKREPPRQLARASAPAKERPPARDTSMAATLKACREHGYHATQCIKQDCSVTQYGFVCRGQ